MAKRSASGVSLRPKPPKLALPKPLKRPSHPKPASLKQAALPARPYQPKPAKLAAPRPPVRPTSPKPPSLNFPKPHTSDSLSVIPDQRRPVASPALKAVPTKQRRVETAVASVAAPPPAAATAKVPVKVVLWISSYPALLATTSLMLQAEGFDVHTASDFLQVQSACAEDRFQLAIVDHTLAPKIKRAIAAVIREKRPGTVVLELCQVSSEIPDADYLLIGHDPDALVRMVLRIARERNS